jgi:hypothetical protein
MGLQPDDDKPGAKLPPITPHFRGTESEYVRTTVPVVALAARWRLVVRDYQHGKKEMTLALEGKRVLRK